MQRQRQLEQARKRIPLTAKETFPEPDNQAENCCCCTISIGRLAAASGTLTRITIDFLAVQLSLHFVAHAQALGNTTR